MTSYLKGVWGFSLPIRFPACRSITILPEWFIARKKQSQIRTQDVKRCRIDIFLSNFEEKTKCRNILRLSLAISVCVSVDIFKLSHSPNASADPLEIFHTD